MSKATSNLVVLDAPLPVVQVRLSAVEDCRRAVFLVLAESGLTGQKQARLAHVITARLRDDGLLASSVEQLYKATETAGLISRSPEHVVAEAKRGAFGVVYRDAGGWLIPASGVHAWLARRVFTPSVATKTEELAA